jgi:hypothetical protein
MKEQEVLDLIAVLRGTAEDSKILEMLQEEHLKYSAANPERIQLFVDALIDRGVYPKETVPGNCRTVLEMVSSYGAYWYKWREGTLLECPHCKANLRDLEHGPPGLRQIGHVDRGSDRIEFWECPDCHGTWTRNYKPESTVS